MKKKSNFSGLFIVIFAFSFSVVDCATIKMTCRSKGMELELCKKAVEEWRKKKNYKHRVEIVTLPHASNECFALYQQWLSAETFDIDILQMDVAWVGVFSDYFVALDGVVDKDDLDAEKLDVNDYFPAIKENMYSHGKMVALPWYTDCGVMYYRKDLLEKYKCSVPETWQDLYTVAKLIQDEERKIDINKRGKFYGLALQAKAFEILTCNFVEFLDSFGGAIVSNGRVEIDSQQSINATLFLIKCLQNITSRSVLNYSEEDARGMFQSGNAVFMRNWPYAWSLLNDPSTSVAGKIGVMPIPPSSINGKRSGVLGGWFLTVSRYSKNSAIAADLVKFLTSKTQQKRRAAYSYLPAFRSLYLDPEVTEANPFFKEIYKSLENAVARPSIAFGKNYSRASSEIYNTINTILSESVESKYESSDIKKALSRLAKRLKKILKKSVRDRGMTPAKKGTRKDGLLTRINNAVANSLTRFKKFFGGRGANV